MRPGRSHRIPALLVGSLACLVALACTSPEERFAEHV
jgi:hypothetical protein